MQNSVDLADQMLVPYQDSSRRVAVWPENVKEVYIQKFLTANVLKFQMLFFLFSIIALNDCCADPFQTSACLKQEVLDNL